MNSQNIIPIDRNRNNNNELKKSESANESGLREILSINETAALLGVNAATIYSLVRKKELPSFKVAKRVLVRRSTLEAWIRQQEFGG